MDDIRLAYFMLYNFYQYVNLRRQVALSNIHSKSAHLVSLLRNE